MTTVLLLAFGLILQAGATSQIDRAVEAGISGGVYPGAVVMVGTGHRVLYAKGYGHFTWSADSRVPDPDSTLWDLASLTKVVATTPAAMLLVQAATNKVRRAYIGGRPKDTTNRTVS